MKIKTSELKGDALDWAVAKCEQELYAATHHGKLLSMDYLMEGCASTDWSEGGPIIERERITSSYEGKGVWIAGGFNGVAYIMNYPGPTPLIAAMRCYVASRLGDEVEVPDELKGD